MTGAAFARAQAAPEMRRAAHSSRAGLAECCHQALSSHLTLNFRFSVVGIALNLNPCVSSPQAQPPKAIKPARGSGIHLPFSCVTLGWI